MKRILVGGDHVTNVQLSDADFCKQFSFIVGMTQQTIPIRGYSRNWI